MLTCACDREFYPGCVVVWGPETHTTLDTARERRCKSCGRVIQPGDLVAKFDRYKVPETMMEERIYGEYSGEEGEGVPRAPHYVCEDCGDQYFNRTALGFCGIMPTTILEDLQEYHELQEERLEDLHAPKR